MSGSAAANPATQGIGLGPVAEVVLALGVVLLAIVALAWVLRRLQAGGAGASAQLRIVAALAVGTRERIVVLDAGGTQLLIGIAPGRITRLHEFPQPVISAQPPAGDFATRLRQAIGRGEGA